MAAPYRVVSQLPPMAGFERFIAEDARGTRVWIFQSQDRSPACDERMLAAAARCVSAPMDVVPVVDSGRDPSGRAWVATAPLPGTGLGEWIQKYGALEAAVAVRACARLAEVLEALAPLGLLPALPADAVSVVDNEVSFVAFSPLPAPLTGREQTRAIGQLLDSTLAIPNRRADVTRVLARCLTDVPDAFVRPGDLAAALHELVGGDTRPSNKTGQARATMVQRPSRAGEVLGSYELVSRLGEGGMGDVYLARHTRLGREVALKLLRPEFANDADVVRRFFQEARVVNEVNHPHIVEVIDFVEQAPHVFCVMELLKGSTLGDLAFGTPLSIARIVDLVGQTCEALHAAHTHGVIHRDVKPANIFVTERNGKPDFVKLLDFGVARLAKTAAPHRTQVGLVIGTPAYMSPEQATGRSVDARTDIYAVGAVLFELLSGQTLSTAARPTLPATTQLGEAIPPALGDLTMRCVSMDPLQRPATAQELIVALAQLGAPPAPETTQKAMVAAGLAPVPAKGNRVVWVGAFVGALAVGAGGFWMLRPAAEPMPPPVLVPAPAPVALSPPTPPTPAVPPVVVIEDPPAEKVPPPPVVPPSGPVGKKHPAHPLPAGDQLSKRVTALRKNYAALVQSHGAAQLTSVERARVNQAFEDSESSDLQSLATTLPEAEQALKVASQRLGP